MEKFITVTELADALSVPVATVYHWSSTGTGPRRIRVGKRVLFRITEIERWLESRTVADDRHNFTDAAG
jgi:excisionase family DNA binding protein